MHLDVIDPYPQFGVAGNCLASCFQPLRGRASVYRILQRILWRHDQVHGIEILVLRQMAHDGKVTDVQRIEGSGIDSDFHGMLDEC